MEWFESDSCLELDEGELAPKIGMRAENDFDAGLCWPQLIGVVAKVESIRDLRVRSHDVNPQTVIF